MPKPQTPSPDDLIQRIAALFQEPAERQRQGLKDLRAAFFKMRGDCEAFGYENGRLHQLLSPNPVQMKRLATVPPISEQQTVTVDGVLWSVAAMRTEDGWATYAVQIGEKPKDGNNFFSLEELPGLQFRLDGLLDAEFAAEFDADGPVDADAATAVAAAENRYHAELDASATQ